MGSISPAVCYRPDWNVSCERQVVRTIQVFSMLVQNHSGSFDVLNEGGKSYLNNPLWVDLRQVRRKEGAGI